MTGLEEDLIGMVRHDVDFVDGQRGARGRRGWRGCRGDGHGSGGGTADGEAELHKIPFFVWGKVRRNTESFARERGLARIDAETLDDAKANFIRWDDTRLAKLRPPSTPRGRHRRAGCGRR